MVKYIKHISLLIALAFIAGCNPGITEPDQLTLAKISDYFWNSGNNQQLLYENFRVKDASKTQFEYAFSQITGASSDGVISRIPQPNPDSFYYRYDTSGSLLVKGLNYNTLFPLPDGYHASNGDTLYDTSYDPISMRKVLALNNRKVVAIDKENIVYYSTTNGESWQKSAFKKEVFGVITSWSKVVTKNKNEVYAGTSTGYCIRSTDGGNNWDKKLKLGTIPLTSIAASSSGNVFAATESTVFYSYSGASGKADTMSVLSPITSLAVCESVTYGGSQYNVFIATSDDTSAMEYWVFTAFQSFRNGKNSANNRELSLATATGESTAIASGYQDALGHVLLYTNDGGQNWSFTKLPIQQAHFFSASMVNDSPRFIVANKNGDMYIGHHYLNSIPEFRVVSPASAAFHINDISISGTAIIAAVDSVGIMVSTDDGVTWTPGSKGLGKETITPRKSEGYITLLENRDGGLMKGHFWNAGTLTMTNGSSTLTTSLIAEVREAWSKIDLPFSAGTYENVFEVLYSCTPPNRKEYKVHVFYAKGVGPILFQRFEGEDLIDESYLVKK
jgi:photosystem II stability/assembly factor-like uncharacterized protein